MQKTALNPASKKHSMDDCVWTKEHGSGFHWVTHCGHEFVLVDENPKTCEFVFCPYCGASIILYDIDQ